MPPKRSGLGRGLDALLPKVEPSGVRQVEVEKLRVSDYQPRKYLDPEAINELAASVADKGIIQPLVVRPLEDGYEIVAGERRYRAAKQVGLATVPVVVKDLSDQETLEIAIIENLQREDLNPVEEARAFKKLQEFGLNQEKVAKAVGKSRSAIANTLRLLNLSDESLDALQKGEISAGHARAILSQPEEDREWAFAQIRSLELSVRQSEELSRATALPDSKRGRSSSDGRYEDLQNDLAKHVGTRVKIKGGTKGKLELFFYSTDELERLLELMGYQA